MNSGRDASEIRSRRRVRKSSKHRVRRRSASALIALLMLFAGTLSGCGATRPSKYYQLTVPPDPPAIGRSDSVPVSLLVGGFMTSHLYREDRIVYGTGREELGTYEYQRWAEPPCEMIEEILLRELRASGHYRAVHIRRSNVKGDFLLRGRLYDFKEVEENPLAARVTFEVEMRDLKNDTVVWSHYYTHDEPATEKSVAAMVAALDQNVQQGIKEIVAGINEYFASHPAK